MRRDRAKRLALAAVLAAAPALAGGEEPDPAAVAAGEYVFRVAGCAGCHTVEEGPLAGGGRALETPFGTFYGPNITPHPEHGIGGWSAADLERALRHGVAPDGSHYYPVFPYPSFTRMRTEDVRALHRYLMTLEPVPEPAPPHEVPWYLGFRILNWFWKLLFFEPGEFQPDPARSAAWNRGAYLVQGWAHCGECHTPRNLAGAMDAERFLAGNPHGPEGASVPNVTPHEEDGIGRWSPTEIIDYITWGMLPDGDFAGGAMAEVIERGLKHLRPEDARAIADYLLSLEPRPSAAGDGS